MCVGGRWGGGGPEYEECDQGGWGPKYAVCLRPKQAPDDPIFKISSSFFYFFTRIIWTQFEENRLFGHFLLKIAPIMEGFPRV